jgi:hypothetical protein
MLVTKPVAVRESLLQVLLVLRCKILTPQPETVNGYSALHIVYPFIQLI